MSLLTDNPVALLVLARARRQKRRLTTVAVPLGFAVLLLLSVPFLVTSSTFPWTAGQVLFFPLALAYWAHVSLIPFWTCPDPLLAAVREGTAEQVVVSGLSPVTWACGHLLVLGVECVLVLSAYVPPAVVCWYLGGVRGVTLLVVAVLGVVMAITLRLFWLLFMRLPVVALSAALAVLLMYLLPLLDSIRVQGVLRPALAPYLGLSPLLVLWQHIGMDALLPAARFSPVLATGNLVCPVGCATLSRHLVLHVAVWGFCLLGIVVGPARAQSLVPGSWGRLHGGTGSVAAGTSPGRRRLSRRAVMWLFQQNNGLSPLGLWEFFWFVAVTLAVGLAVGIVLGAATRRAWLQPGIVAGGWTGWAVALLALLLLLLAVMDSCCSPGGGAARQARLLRLPVVAVFALRCGVILAGLQAFLRSFCGFDREYAAEVVWLVIVVLAGATCWGWVCLRAGDRRGIQWRLLQVVLAWFCLPPLLALIGSILFPGPAGVMRVASLSPAWGLLGYFLPPEVLSLSRSGLFSGGTPPQAVDLAPAPFITAVAAMAMVLAALLCALRRAEAGEDGP